MLLRQIEKSHFYPLITFRIVFILVFLSFIASCFGGGVDKRGSVTGYRNGIVLTKGGKFQVGILPSSWKREKFSYRAVLFSHDKGEMSIAAQSFCKGSADDASLPVLSSQLYYGILNQDLKLQEEFTLDNRGALRRVIQGTLDGVPVILDTVVLKMNQCVFDFIYTSAPEKYFLGKGDFETFYQGFHYIQGPPLEMI